MSCPMLLETLVQDPRPMLKISVTRTLVASLLFLCNASPILADSNNTCLTPGQWAQPTNVGAEPASVGQILARSRKSDFVLLGEAHDNPDHHLWQLQALSMLLGQRDEMVIGMEMFPRRVQPVLDRWVAGDLTEAQFLEQSDWNRVWRFDPELYLPILRFARLNRIPLVALNVERSLISETSTRGWEAIAENVREGVTDPAPASEAYREILRSVFEQHSERQDSEYERFVQAQLVWDRAFAQALADAASSHPGSLIIGIIGSGHLRYGHGVPHQLGSLGQQNVVVWLPMTASGRCDEVADIADAVFGVKNSERIAPPRLGIYLQDTDNGIEIRDVLPGSVAEAAGFISGDRIMSAAGVTVRGSDEVIAIVRRQSPGTWLPVTVARNGNTIDIVAKFPATLPTSD